MPIDFKKELENAARSMILVHDPDVLIKTIIRALVDKAGIEHASVLLYDPKRQAYVLSLSGGSLSKKVPIGFASLDKDDPLIRFFREHNNRLVFNKEILTLDSAEKALSGNALTGRVKSLLNDALYQAKLLDTVACIPSYFRDDLLCLFLLGRKKNGKEFLPQELDFFSALASNMAMAIRNAQLFKDLESELNKKHQLFMRTTIALVAAIEAKDNYTHGHTTRVSNFSLQIARRLKNKNKKLINERFVENLHIASLLHDVGKIGIPEHILNKRSGLTVGERNRIKEHPLIGATILKPIKELEESVVGIKYHHERPDGLGYPEGLKGKDIPLIASIISVADSFDAMTTERPYRPALSRDEAVKEIRKLSNLQFSPQVTEAFMELCLEGVL